MRTHLYSHALLPAWQADTDDPTTMQIASAALFFDSFYLTGFQYPYVPEDILDEGKRVGAHIEQIKAKFGERRLVEFLNGNTDGLSIYDFVALNYALFLQAKAGYYDTYEPLRREGIIIDTTPASSDDAVGDAITSDPDHTIALLYDFLSEHLSAVTAWTHDPECLRQVYGICNQSTSATSSIAYRLLQTLREGGLDEFGDQPVGNSNVFPLIIGSMSLLCHSLSSTTLSTPRIYLGIEAANIGRAFEQFLLQGARASESAVAHRLMSHILAALPAIVPRSPESILELRSSLNDELQTLREVIQSASSDLTADSANERLQQVVSQRFIVPLNMLRRRLAHPTRDIIRNIVTGSPLATAISLAAAPLLGLPFTAGAALGVSLNLLGTALKTKIERQRIVEESPVAFLLLAEGRASSAVRGA